MCYAREAAVQMRPSIRTRTRFVPFWISQERMELVLTVAWYNCIVRILLPLRIEKEDWFVRL